MSLFLKVEKWLRENVPTVESDQLVAIKNQFIALELDEEFLQVCDESDITTLPLEGFTFKLRFYIKKALKCVKKGL